MLNFLPARYNLGLKWLGGKDWLDVIVNPERTSYAIKPIVATQEDYAHYAAEDIMLAKNIVDSFVKSGTSADIFFILALAKSIATGPKVFKPTFEQCLALENTEINVPFDFYQQPYPVVILDIPKEYKDRIKTMYEISVAPSHVLSIKHENVVAVSAWFNQDNSIVNIISRRQKYTTIEDAIVSNRERQEKRYEIELLEAPELKETEQEKAEYSVAELVQRLAMNFSLMMTLLGVKIGPPANTTQDKVEKQKKILRNKKSSAQDKYRAKRLLADVAYLIEFNQNIEFYEVEERLEKGDPTGKSHASPKPHWRKGHFRLQHYGVDNIAVKLIFIKPVMVKAAFFVGDIANTQVTYTAKHKNNDK
jgi:hypothetical protein